MFFFLDSVHLIAMKQNHRGASVREVFFFGNRKLCYTLHDLSWIETIGQVTPITPSESVSPGRSQNILNLFFLLLDALCFSDSCNAFNSEGFR